MSQIAQRSRKSGHSLRRSSRNHPSGLAAKVGTTAGNALVINRIIRVAN